MGVESPYEKSLICDAISHPLLHMQTFLVKVTAPLYNMKGDFFMPEIILTVLKIVAIVFFAMYIGNKTGFFSLSRAVSVVVLIILAVLFSLEIYSSFFRDDISLLVVFNSSFLNFTLDLSFFLRIFIATLLIGLICSVAGVKPGVKINTVKELCVLALLIAITSLLAIYCTIRIGAGIKVSFKFISVFVTAAIFGPVWGGAVGAIADVVAYLVNPVGGPLIPQITFVEFLYGFIFGLFFFNAGSWKSSKMVLRVVFCTIIHILFLNLGLTSYFLMPILNMSFENVVILRAVSALISFVVNIIVLIFMCRYIPSFKRILK